MRRVIQSVLVLFSAVVMSFQVASAASITTVEATISNANGSSSESALGDLVADSLRDLSGSDIALVYSGDLEQYLLGGTQSIADIRAAVPNNSPYVVADLSGQEINGLLEQGVSGLVLDEKETLDYIASESGTFFQVSGLNLRCDVSAPVGQRILNLMYSDGSPLAENEIYTVVLPEAALSSEQLMSSQFLGGIQSLFFTWLEEHPTISPPELNRIRLLGAHTNPLIGSAPVLMLGIIMLMCAVMAVPSILQKKKNPEARESVYFTGLTGLRNKK